MKSGLRRLANQGKTPVPLATRRYGSAGSHVFNLGVGRADRESQLRSYHRSGTVRSIVSLLAEAAASATWCLYRKEPQDMRRRYSTGDQGSDQRTEVIQHAALSLVRSPNDFHTQFEFFEGCNQHLELTGETFWVLDLEQTTFPTSMWYVRPDRMEPVPDPDDYLIGWIYSGPNGEQVPLALDEVIQEKLPDPLDQYRGAGPVSAIMPNIEQQRYATEYQRNLFLNGATPGGIIQVPNRLTQPEFDELVDRWREGHQGIARAGRVGVLESGATWIGDAPTNKDMEYGALRLANRDEIREAWRMHKSMLGTVEDVNRANAQTAEEVFVTWMDVPRLERRKNTLNHKLLPKFGTSGQGVEFDYHDPSPVNQEAAIQELLVKAQAVQALVAAGYDMAAVLEVVGLPPMAAPAAVPTGQAGPGNRQSVTLTAKKDAAAKVFQQVAEDFPPEAMAWMHHAEWSGPVEVPLDHIEPHWDWMDGVSPAHVQEFVQRRLDGKKLKPLILVKTPGNDKLDLVDGYHRYAAEAELKEAPRAFIGTVTSDRGAWETMHSQQFPPEPGQRAGRGNNMAAALRRILNDGYVPVTTGRIDA